MRKRYVFSAIFGAIAACVSQCPLAWVAPYFLPETLGQNIRYSGTLWNGQLSGLDYIGTANFTLSPRAFVSGNPPLKFSTQSPALSVSGQGSRHELKDIRFNGVLAKLPTRDGRLKELAGQVNFQISELKLDDGVCQSAIGRGSTDFLTRNQTRWQWRGPPLAGPISCEGGDVVVKLSGRENSQSINANLRLSASGSYAADISVQTNQPEAGVVLPLYGFDKRGRDYKLTEQGQWR